MVASKGAGERWRLRENSDVGVGRVMGFPHEACRNAGLRPSIVEQRRVKKLAQRRRRREENQKQKTGPQKTNKTTTTPAVLVA